MTPTNRPPVDDAVSRIKKLFGGGAIMYGEESVALDPTALNTGLLPLNNALGIGGLVRGRVIEIFGPPKAGKTTLALHLIGRCQGAGGVAAYIDAEHALDPKWAEVNGVDMRKMLVSQPDCAEQALEIADVLARSGSVDFIVIDSTAALTPRAELEGEIGDVHTGLQARLMSQALRKLTAVAARNGTTILFINQLRVKVGVTFGSPETTTGGQALKFYSSVRIDIRSIGAKKLGEEVTAQRCRLKVVKNKLAPPFRQCELTLDYSTGLWSEPDWEATRA